MSNTSSAKKAHRQTLKRTKINRSRVSRMRTFVRKAKEAIAANSNDVVEALRMAESELRRAANHGIIHKNNAFRHISRLYKAYAKKSPPAAAATTTATA